MYYEIDYNNLGWLDFKNCKNNDSNLGISLVTILSKNPLTPA